MSLALLVRLGKPSNTNHNDEKNYGETCHPHLVQYTVYCTTTFLPQGSSVSGLTINCGVRGIISLRIEPEFVQVGALTNFLSVSLRHLKL